MASSAAQLYPSPSRNALREAFVGKTLQDVHGPTAVIDRVIVARNCKQMLDACHALEIDFRSHTKSHKTAEVTKLQVGETSDEVKLVVSTISEAEFLYSYLCLCRSQGKKVNVIYGLPLPLSQASRLGQLGKDLGPGTMSAIVDHPDQLNTAYIYHRISGSPMQIFIKVDTGYHRAGLSANSIQFQQLVSRVLYHEQSGTGQFVGFYSHAGHSYGGDSAEAALRLLVDEIRGLEEAATQAFPGQSRRAILSVGATPTVTSIQALLKSKEDMSPGLQSATADLLGLIKRVKESHTLELHAGVYPFLDMQQLATKASPSAAQSDVVNGISTSDIALTVLTEVNSIYPHRSNPEALIAAGSLTLGREPCKSYPGWGIVSDWNTASSPDAKLKTGRSGWQVGRISQEHGILTKDSVAFGQEAEAAPSDLKVGQKVKIWPNHACVAGAMFGWYLVVDSSLKGREDEIVDVWVRCRGW
ncbi:MAG: hypothetical protein Q9163_000780 [Psora crenata]